jgi:cytochrome c oxidase cbb3-type subunit 3
VTANTTLVLANLLRRWACLLLTAFASLLLSQACAQQSRIPGKANPLDAPNVQAGRQLFQQTCGMCHGPEARGGEGPSLVDSFLIRHDDNGSLIGPLLHRGRVEKGMPAFAYLDDNQVLGIVAFLHATVEASDNRSSKGPVTGYSRGQLLSGNVQAGQSFFAANCAGCHSVTGDLAGVGKKYAPLELEKRILYPPLRERTGAVWLPSGKKYTGSVVHLDSFFVAIKDADGVYHSWPLATGIRVVLDDPLHGHRELLSRYHDKDIHDVFTYLETLP